MKAKIKKMYSMALFGMVVLLPSLAIAQSAEICRDISHELLERYYAGSERYTTVAVAFYVDEGRLIHMAVATNKNSISLRMRNARDTIRRSVSDAYGFAVADLVFVTGAAGNHSDHALPLPGRTSAGLHAEMAIVAYWGAYVFNNEEGDPDTPDPTENPNIRLMMGSSRGYCARCYTFLYTNGYEVVPSSIGGDPGVNDIIKPTDSWYSPESPSLTIGLPLWLNLQTYEYSRQCLGMWNNAWRDVDLFPREAGY